MRVDASKIDAALAVKLDEMAARSATSQGLTFAITSSHNLREDIVFLAKEEESDKIVGFIRCGRRHLFFFGDGGRAKECDPWCLLDFFVEAPFRRNGYGKLLFDEMLSHLQLEPWTLAFDRPSNATLSFLTKHFKMIRPIWHPNKFVSFTVT